MASFFSTRGKALVPLARLALAAYMWYPVLYTLNLLAHEPPGTTTPETAGMMLKGYLQWLAGWNDTSFISVMRFLFVLWEMRAYISNRGNNHNNKSSIIDDSGIKQEEMEELAERCLRRSEAVFSAWAFATWVYMLLAFFTSKPLPEVPWFLLVSNYGLILAVVAISCASTLPNLTQAAVLARMVLLFPARQLFPWTSLEDVFCYVTGRRHLVKSEPWLKWGKDDFNLAAGDDDACDRRWPFVSAFRRLFIPIYLVIAAPALWALFARIWCWPQVSVANKVSATATAMLIILPLVPWCFASYVLARLVERTDNEDEAAANVKACLETSGKQSLILTYALCGAQLVYLQIIGASGDFQSNMETSPLRISLVFGILLFALALYRSGASRQEWRLAARLMLRLPDSLFFPRLQGLSLYNYFRGRHHLVPQVMLTCDQKAALQSRERQPASLESYLDGFHGHSKSSL